MIALSLKARDQGKLSPASIEILTWSVNSEVGITVQMIREKSKTAFKTEELS